MDNHHFKMATFNTYNLALPEKLIHGKEFLRPEEYRKKIDWTAGQLKNMDADIVAFQEVFHRQALEDALRASGIYSHAWLEVADETGDLPRVALLSRFPVRGFRVIRDFPPAGRVDVEGVSVALGQFRRPLIQAWITLPSGQDMVVFVVHLKSKRPSVPPEQSRHDPLEEAKGSARALLQRAAEAVALRALILSEIEKDDNPLVLMGDLNDSTHSVTSDILMGRLPMKHYPRDVKEKLWKRALYSTNDIQIRKSYKDVYYTHLHDSQYESLDHILVSQEFFTDNPNKIGYVEYMRVYNDHLLDPSLSSEDPPPWCSDHGQVVVSIRMKK